MFANAIEWALLIFPAGDPTGSALGDGGDAEGDACDSDVIPTLSQWGLIVTTLLLMVVAKVYLGRREVGVD